MKTYLSAILVSLALAIIPLISFSQQVFDFELPSLSEGATIFDQYGAGPCGVTFFLGDSSLNVHPILAEVGGNSYFAFQGPSRTEPACGVNSPSQFDMPAAGQNVGCKFLTDDGNITGPPEPLNIYYNSSTSQASGYLLDIDGDEEYLFKAYNGTSLVSSFVMNTTSPGSGDGLATYWEFNLSSQFNRIEVVYTGPNNSTGLAFDNFSSCTIQMPSVPTLSEWGLAILALSILCLGSIALRIHFRSSRPSGT